MKNAEKFTFDTIFSKTGEILNEPPKPQKRSYLAKDVDIIRKDAVAEGTRSAQAQADQAIASSLKQMSAVVEGLFNLLDKEVEHVRAEAAQLAFAIGTKIAGKHLEENPTQGIQALIDDCLANLRSEPHIHIQVHPQNAEEISERIQSSLNGRSFGGQLHISPSDGLSETDVRIEWANGGVEKSHHEIIKAIATVIDERWNTSVGDDLADLDEAADQREDTHEPARLAAGPTQNS
jgi:flagellar assembly protein FliH